MTVNLCVANANWIEIAAKFSGGRRTYVRYALLFHPSVWMRESSIRLLSLGTRPSKNRKGGSGTSAEVEVYTAPGMKVHFRLAFD